LASAAGETHLQRLKNGRHRTIAVKQKKNVTAYQASHSAIYKQRHKNSTINRRLDNPLAP
jgi:hypothetical protein